MIQLTFVYLVAAIKVRQLKTDVIDCNEKLTQTCVNFLGA